MDPLCSKAIARPESDPTVWSVWTSPCKCAVSGDDAAVGDGRVGHRGQQSGIYIADQTPLTTKRLSDGADGAVASE
jgi:hypothetical protein